MAQPQYYEILNENDKNPEQQQYFSNEDHTVQYVITPDKSHFQTQQIIQEQILQAQIVQQPIIQHPMQLQPSQFTVIKDGTLRQEGQQVFFVENTIADGILIENKIQSNEIPQQPIILNHQIGNTVVRGPIMKAGQQISLEMIQKAAPQKVLSRSPNPNQLRQVPPNIRQQVSTVVKSNQLNVQASNQQQQVRLQQQIRPGLVRNVPQYRPLAQNIGIRQSEQNRQTVRHPQSPQHQRSNQIGRGMNTLQGPRTPQLVTHQNVQQQQMQKTINQGNDINNVEMNSTDDQDTVTLPDGSMVTMAAYNNMLKEQKNRNPPKKPNTQQPNQQNQQIQQTNTIQLQNNQLPQHNQIQAQNQLQPTNPVGVPNVRPKKRTPASPRPRASPKNAAKTPPRPRGSPIASNQQQQSSPGPFSMLNQNQQQAVNKIQQPNQFQNQMSMQQQPQNQIQQQQTQNQLQRQMQQQPQQIPQQTQARKPSQANYIIQPPKNQKSLQRRPLPVYIPSSQIQKIIESTPISDEFSDSIRMLVFLENGEQRLITFTLPKEACTIQEILDQVNVPLQADTNIQVIETNYAGINYIVTVGNVTNLNLQEDESAPQAQQQEELISQPPALVACKPHDKTIPVQDELNQTPQKLDPPKSPSPEPVKELPKLIPGMLALCGACGYLSEDFNKCIRCQRKLPETVKTIPANVKHPPGLIKRDISAVAQAQLAKHQAWLQQQKANNASNAANKSNNVSSQKKKVSASKASKAPEQDSIHVISSDEEDDESSNKLNDNLFHKLGSSVTICPVSKEPSTLDIQRHTSSKNNTPQKSYSDKDILKTKLKCRTIRIGSYRCVPIEEVQIETTKVVMKVPHPNKEKGIKTIIIERSDIVKVLASFNSSLPVIFFYLDSGLAKKVRDELDMTSDSDYYFDPLSIEEEAHKRITFLPDDIPADTQNVFELVFKYPSNILEELNIKEANDILIKTCPKETRNTPGFGAFAEIKQLVTYPLEGRYRITINTEDYMCLAQDQFLNDVIIDFYITYLTENLPEVEKNKIHVFSTFFYRRLTTKPLKASRKLQPSELDPTLTPAQKRHARVQKWTKNVNIFEKDFVVVPINENAHWFLAIICFPGMEGTHTWDGKPIKIEVKSTKKKKPGTNSGTAKQTVAVKQEKVAKPISCEDPELSDKDEAEGDDSELESDDSEEVPLSLNDSISSVVSVKSETGDMENSVPPSPTPKGPKEPRPPIKQPCILIFDSLSSNRCRVVATLRDYLTCEYKAKMGKEKIYNKEVIKGASPKVPQQNNFTDCGLYLLQYVEQFLKDPIKDFHIPIKEIKNWFEEIVVTKKREDIANLIKTLMKKSGKDPRLLPEIIFPTQNGKIVEREPEEEEEEEECEEEMMEEEEEDDALSTQAIYSKSFSSLNSSRDSNLDYMSGTEEIKSEETGSPLKPSSDNNSGDFVTQPVVNPKPDLSEFPRQTNKATLSILKAKRIIKNKSAEGPLIKKLKSDQD